MLVARRKLQAPPKGEFSYSPGDECPRYEGEKSLRALLNMGYVERIADDSEEAIAIRKAQLLKTKSRNKKRTKRSGAGGEL